MRAPDLVIGPEDRPYMLRWVIFRWRGWQIAIHKILASDDDRALHDHVGDNVSLILRGWYLEIDDRGPHVRKAWLPIFRKAETPHRLVLVDSSPVWTLWLRCPARREWGFHCQKGWRHWREYCSTDSDNYDSRGQRAVSVVGRGCD